MNLTTITKQAAMQSKRAGTTMRKLGYGLLATAMLSVTGLTALQGVSRAATVNPVPTANVSFTFDDGLASAYTNAAPTLQKYGLAGTNYVISNCVGLKTIPNSCHANNDASYMTWTQVTALQNTYGWEIGSHTATHPYLATSDANDGQANVLTPTQVATELTGSKTTFASHGITATDFSSPYGDYNNAVLARVAKVYASHRGFADEGINTLPNNDYLLYDYRVQAGVSVAQVEAKIDAAIANKQWLILTFHDIQTKASTNPDDYQYNTADLDKIAAYVKAKQTAGLVKSTTINKGLVTGDTNMLANSSFDSGLANGWRTDNATAVTVDKSNNGSYPSAANSIKFTPNSKAGRLYSPVVPVSNGTTYVLKNFLNVQSRTAGQVEFYIDEYDVNGNWVSGQFKKAEASAFVESMNFSYTPSSPAVAKADLQITNTAGSTITAYLDNSQWFATSTTAAAQTNLVANGDFAGGISQGWTTDNTAVFAADAANNGGPNNAATSVKLTSAATTTHLFSPKVAVVSTQKYSLASYLNLKTITGGEIAFYIDEYDTNGNWVSGQYKVGVHTLGAGDVGFSYQPTSANVKTASLQVIATGNPGTTGYFDDVRWYKN